MEVRQARRGEEALGLVVGEIAVERLKGHGTRRGASASIVGLRLVESHPLGCGEPNPHKGASLPIKTSPTGSEPFIVHNSDDGWRVRKYLHDCCDLSKAIDIATGYFEIGSLLALDGE